MIIIHWTLFYEIWNVVFAKCFFAKILEHFKPFFLFS